MQFPRFPDRADCESLHFAAAEARDFPPWLGPVEASTPLNATPYLIALSQLRSGTALGHHRRWTTLIASAVDTLAAQLITVVGALIGGSVLRRGENPRDLDCVLFYTVADAAVDLDLLSSFQLTQKAGGLDVRLIPVDGDPLVIVRATTFFTTLYTGSKPPGGPQRGLVLVDCRR